MFTTRFATAPWYDNEIAHVGKSAGVAYRKMRLHDQRGQDEPLPTLEQHSVSFLFVVFGRVLPFGEEPETSSGVR
jgi:hypothetical protein